MPDPITLLVSVLAAGAEVAGKEVVSQAVKDAYNGLKNQIMSKFTSKPKVSATLETLEVSPKSKEIQGAVEKVFRDAGVDKDEDIGKLTEILRTKLEQENLLSKTVYQAKVKGSGAVAQGKGAVAAGAGGFAVGGNVHGNVTPGEKPGQS